MRKPGIQDNNSFGSSGANYYKVIPEVLIGMLKAD